MAMSKISIDEIIEQCKHQGIKVTPKRQNVLSMMLGAKKPLSAYEIADLYKDEIGETIPVMSVYRMLDFFESEKLVHKLNLTNKYVACSHISCSHPHKISQFLICYKCQAVKEIMVDASVMNVIASSVSESGYQLIAPQFELRCLCNECNLENKTSI